MPEVLPATLGAAFCLVVTHLITELRCGVLNRPVCNFIFYLSVLITTRRSWWKAVIRALPHLLSDAGLDERAA